MYYNEDIIYETVKKILKTYNLDDIIKISEDDISMDEIIKKDGYTKEYIVIINDERIRKENAIIEIRRKNIFGNYFDSLSVRRENDKGIFYHFIKYDYLNTTILKNKIRLNSLSSLLEKDPLEYSDLKNIVRPQRIWLAGEKETKDNIFIFCFMKDFRNRKFWKTYGTNKDNNKVENIAIGFRFKNFCDFNNTYKYLQPIKLRDVIYNLNNSFDFMREIQATLKIKFNVHFQFDNINEFAGLFKREKYKWEDEVRLLFDYGRFKLINDVNKKIGLKPLKINGFKKNDDFTNFRLKNSIFELEIVEFICGKDIEEKKYKELEQKAKEKNINIWKYDNY
jgi:hypothetical protein